MQLSRPGAGSGQLLAFAALGALSRRAPNGPAARSASRPAAYCSGASHGLTQSPATLPAASMTTRISGRSVEAEKVPRKR